MEDTMGHLMDIQKLMQRMGKDNPSLMKSFQGFMQESKKDGALSSKIKELIGVAVSVKAQCERCIAWHVKGALDLGSSKEEILEAAHVAIVLGGGPSLMYMKNVYDALDTLAK
ncbi:MAG: carboxymuconolactone decarboxylase family protein [Promethearchaeota archaeon]